ncbi:hypothetical protein AC579_9226 [Pseudocercospora musae]|uniref:Uncharacterized protein n=1 Tax=Pseudocercospora musae TaxID=113226 RepID=A0A139IAW6_9PEZI|nr:hypothetical protein AC579_9226 [Pseudocercospora musae]
MDAFSLISGQQRSKRSPDNFTPIDHRDPLPVETLPVIQDGVVDIQVLQDLHNGQWCARED